MMASRVTPPVIEEEGVEVEGADKEGGTTKVVGSVFSTYGHFNQS